MSTESLSDPSGWSDEQLDRHARQWLDLPLMQPGPLPSPPDHPDNDPLRPVPGLQSEADFKADLAYLYELVDRIDAATRRAA